MPVAKLSWTALLFVALATGCDEETPRVLAQAPAPEVAHRTPAPAMTERPLRNRYAYIPPQCYTKTKDRRGAANPCYVCHTAPQAPNYVDDQALQLQWQMPPLAAHNPWSNLFSPAIERAAPISDEALLRYVRSSNYVEGARIALADQLAKLPEAWDGDGDARWDGFVPDAHFRFDAQGYDLRPDGAKSGWRAFAYAPLPGTFFPTNGSASDVLMRLHPALRENAAGEADELVEATNYAIVEALITRRDVAFEVDEVRLGVDLDLNGKLTRATHIKFAAEGMHYVGRARGIEGTFPIAPGLFPLETEFLHSLRYLDVDGSGHVVMAARMKELRYAKKRRWFSDADLKAHAAKELVEQQESPDGALQILWEHDHGIWNGQGWVLQGFIEDKDGALRPQTHEESVFCAGCHGDIGATTDSMFAFARKLAGPDGGWFHWTQRDFSGLPEPRRADGRYEYELYLRQNRAGDEFRDNQEVKLRFFDGDKLRPEAVQTLHQDIGSLLVPSPERAFALNRAYRAVVLEQSYERGRDAVLAASTRVYHEAPVDKPTGIARVLTR